MRKFLVGVLGSVLLLAGAPARASGYLIYEQGARASAQASAFVARADDPSALFYNPAGIVRLPGWQLYLGTTAIQLGDTTYRSPSGGEDDMAENLVFPSHLYLTHQASDRFSWGIGIYTPFGLETEWDDTAATRFSSRHAQLVTAYVSPTLAIRCGERGSVAVGVVYAHGEVKNYSRNLGTNVPPPGGLGAPSEGYTNLSGDDDDLTFNVAFQWVHPGGFQVGLVYRGGADLRIDDGDVVFGVDPTIRPLFPDQIGAAALPLPANASVGFAYTGGERWGIEFDLVWTQWSDFDQLDLDFSMETSVPTGLPPPFPATSPVLTDQTIRENWDDTFSYRVGFEYRFHDQHALLLGGYFDENPIPDETVRPSLPDGDRLSVQAGYGFTSGGGGFHLDAYYQYIAFDDRDVAAVANDASVVPGTYETSINLFGVSAGWRF